VVAAVVLAACGAPAAESQTARPETSRIIMLGTGMPVPDANAWGPATAIAMGDRLFLIDAGAGVTRRFAAAGYPRISKIDATFITHLHSDHTLGYPDLIFTTWIMGRRDPLMVFGPPGLRRMTDRILDAWREDVEVRVHGLEHETRASLAVNAREVRPGVVYSRDGVRVTAFKVRHTAWKNAFGYRFDLPDRSITISGDTAPPSDDLIAAAKGTDVLIHGVYIESRLTPEKRPGGEDWPAYMHAAHTSNVELGRLAARVQPKLLILNHVIRMGGTDDELIEGIRAGGYTGRVVIARDLDVF